MIRRFYELDFDGCLRSCERRSGKFKKCRKMFEQLLEVNFARVSGALAIEFLVSRQYYEESFIDTKF